MPKRENFLWLDAIASCQTYQQLDQVITDALAAVTPKHIIEWFTPC
ncbi:MAG: hypothetical protein ACYT04_47480 [Nostoc sp.]